MFEEKTLEIASPDDPAHDFLHFKRVVKSAESLCNLEMAKLEVVLPAAWFHDFINVPKNDPRRSEASRLSAKAAIQYLREIQYPEVYFAEIAHAIEAHSFSANIVANTIEAKIVQDADRLDGIGAIGIARCFATAGILKRPFYSEIDPFCKVREVNDGAFTIDHFYKKLFKTVEILQTKSAQIEGLRRIKIMKAFLTDLESEILIP